MSTFAQINYVDVLNKLAFVVAICAWLAFITLTVFTQITHTWRRHAMMLIWVSLQTVWWSISIYLRVFQGYREPSIEMSLSKAIIELQGLIGLFVIFAIRLYARRR